MFYIQPYFKVNPKTKISKAQEEHNKINNNSKKEHNNLKYNKEQHNKKGYINIQ